MRRFILFAFALAGLFFSTAVYANNVSISNVKLGGRKIDAHTIKIQFDISWDKAWKNSVNHDAVWVIFKYTADSGNTWGPVTLKTAGTNPSDFMTGTKESGSAFTGLEIVVPIDKKGCFIQPGSTGSGTFNFKKIRVVWDYAADGLSDEQVLLSRVRVLAVEMVYIPQEGFSAGDGTAPATGAQLQFGGSASHTAGVIGSEDALTFGTGADQWYYNTDNGSNDDENGSSFEIPATFPKGFNAFYLMKYEIDEGQWVSFFNSLTDAQKASRNITDSSGKNSNATVNRNTVSWTSGTATTDRPGRACGYLSWMDLAAVCDWSAMRPMTELEFEKAARGPATPVQGEYAWGNTSAVVASTLRGVEDGTETISIPTGANLIINNKNFAGGDGGTGPVATGIFETASAATRAAKGAGYYGNLGLSGNVWEMVVTVGNASGRSFAGTHGDGVLTANGNATNADWPGLDATSANGVTGALGSGRRGGGWSDPSVSTATLSSRYFAGTQAAERDRATGGRCARTAP